MFAGSIVALITPMNDKGHIDKASLKKLITYHINNGTSAVVAISTTGEMSTLNFKERSNIVKLILEFSDDRIPVIVGTGANSTSEAIMLTNIFNKTNVAGCLSVTPYYNNPTQDGLYRHFKAIAESTDLPQILYNVPARTGCDMLPATIARLAKIKNIIGIKESTGKLNRVNEIRNLVKDNFILLSGDDASALEFIQLGGNGVISVTANIAAKEMTKLCALLINGNISEARTLNMRLMPLHQKLFVEPNPIPVKWACKILKLIDTDVVRLPLTSLTNLGKNIIKKALINAGLLKNLNNI